MKRENRTIEVIIGPAVLRSHRPGARDEKTDIGMTRSESEPEPPDPRDEEDKRSEKKRGDKKMWNGNRNLSLNMHVNANVRHKGNGRLRRLVNRKGWPKDEDSSDESHTCSRKEIV